MSRCRSCGAPVLWVVMTSGKRMPLDASPTKGIVMVQEAGEFAAVRNVYTSHFATCPHASTHRKKGKSQ